MPNYTKEEINNLLKEIKKLKEYDSKKIVIKNPKFKELVNIYNDKIKIVKDTKFTAMVNTAVSKMENLQNSQKGFAEIQKNLLNSINEYQRNTHPKLKDLLAEANKKIPEFETKVKQSEARLKELKKKKQLTSDEREELSSLKKVSLTSDHKKELENLKKTIAKIEGQLKEIKSQASKLKTEAQKEAGVATLKSLCNTVWNKNKSTGVFGTLVKARLFILNNNKSNKMKTNEIQAVIDSLSKKDYHKGFLESYNRINDVASFDSNKLDGNISIDISVLRNDAKAYSDLTNSSMEKVKSQVNEENIEKHGISFIFKKIKEAEAIGKKREKDLKAILPELKAYCSCESNDSKIMESLTNIAQYIFLFETLKYSADSMAISSGGMGWKSGLLGTIATVSGIAAFALFCAVIPLVALLGPGAWAFFLVVAALACICAYCENKAYWLYKEGE